MINSGNQKLRGQGLALEHSRRMEPEVPEEIEDYKVVELADGKYFYRPSDPTGTLTRAGEITGYTPPPEVVQRGYAGTSIEAQQLNKALGDLPDDDPYKIAAIDKLQRERTVVTPEGTIIMPGYSNRALGIDEPNGPGRRVIPKPTTDQERAAQGFRGRMQSAETEIARLKKESPNYKPEGWLENARGVFNATATAEHQQYRQAADDWIRAKLRKESGAVISKEEMDKEYDNYFPVYGDGAAVIKQKARARQMAMEQMRGMAGRAAKPAAEPIPLPPGVSIRLIRTE
jgi:hypothetical protein